MPRPRNPKREEARKIWKRSKGKKLLKDIAKELGVSEAQLRNWKNIDGWERNVTQCNEKDNVTLHETERKSRGRQRKGIGNPNPQNQFTKGNSPDVSTHGFFRKIFPEDAHELVESIAEKSPLDMLWENIVIQYTAIARAQKIMHVRDRDDITREVTRGRKSAMSQEIEYEIQYAWDKQANLLNAQSRAQKTLESMISKYEDLLHKNWAMATEEQVARIEQIKANTERLRADSADSDEGVVIVNDV
jgi:uncharacterized protein YjcR